MAQVSEESANEWSTFQLLVAVGRRSLQNGIQWTIKSPRVLAIALAIALVVSCDDSTPGATTRDSSGQPTRVPNPTEQLETVDAFLKRLPWLRFDDTPWLVIRCKMDPLLLDRLSFNTSEALSEQVGESVRRFRETWGRLVSLGVREVYQACYDDAVVWYVVHEPGVLPGEIADQLQLLSLSSEGEFEVSALDVGWSLVLPKGEFWRPRDRIQQEEVPAIASLFRDVDDKPVSIAGVHTDRTVDEMRKWKERGDSGSDVYRQARAVVATALLELEYAQGSMTIDGEPILTGTLVMNTGEAAKQFVIGMKRMVEADDDMRVFEAVRFEAVGPVVQFTVAIDDVLRVLMGDGGR